jgi:hypothetical protein
MKNSLLGQVASRSFSNFLRNICNEKTSLNVEHWKWYDINCCKRERNGLKWQNLSLSLDWMCIQLTGHWKTGTYGIKLETAESRFRYVHIDWIANRGVPGWVWIFWGGYNKNWSSAKRADVFVNCRLAVGGRWMNIVNIYGTGTSTESATNELWNCKKRGCYVIVIGVS